MTDLPQTLWLRRRVTSRIHGAPDIDLDSLNLMEAWVPEIRWWTHVEDIPEDLDLQTNLVYAELVGMRQLQMHLNLQPFPELDTYPAVLQPFLRRKVSRVPDVVRAAMRGPLPMFLKPSRDNKAFTGMVVETRDDIMAFLHCDGVEGWASEVVDWVSEWRVLVCHHEPIAVRHYKGDSMQSLPVGFIREAVRAGRDVLPEGYCLDVGLLGDNLPALVEFNAGYSFGAYEANSTDFCRTLWAWWQENVKRKE